MTAVLASTLYGPMIVPPYDTYLSQAVIRMGQYAPAEFATWRPYIPAAGVVVDAGANIGAHTMAFANAVGPTGAVVAVEPQRTLFYMLCGTIALGNLQQVVHVKHCALAREPGSMKIPLIDYSGPGNFGGLELRRVQDGEDVPAETLDGWQLPRLDFLKIDVEGMELDVLHGGEQTINAHRPVISAEADRELNVLAMLAWFKLHGYRAWFHRPPLGDLWPRIVSINLLALPRERDQLPAPTGDVEPAID